ncbi:unnamed protein product [Lampetra planeri]
MPVPLINLVKTPGDGALIAFHACLATSSVASNSLLLLTLLCSPALLRRNNYLYTLSITISDLIAGAGWFYLGLYDVSQELESTDSPQRVLATVHGISLITILAAMVDRYLAVKHPFKYLQKMTRTKVVIVIAFTWAWPILSIIVRLIFPSGNGQTSQGYVTLVFFTGMFGVMAMPVPLINLVKTPGDGALIAFHACLATSSVASNSLLLLTLLCSPALLRRNNYLYTLSITISDLIAGAGWFYLGLYDVSQELESTDSPQRLLATVHGISLITILAAMVDRYLAVKHPFKYLQKMTRTKVVIVIAFTWAWPVLSIIVRLIFPSGNSQTSQGYVTLVFFAGMFGVMVILNVRLYIITRQQQSREPHTERESKHRSAWLIIFASSLFIALWTPNIVYLSICFVLRRCFSAQNIANSPLSILRILNTLTTPLIFMFGSPLTRASLKALLQRLRFKR